jgi:probable HAF family extracellular repeat protein
MVGLRTNTVANLSTGFPTQDPFFWEDGKMVDIGTLGGTIGYPRGLNKSGQVVGSSNLAGDRVTHAFVWDKKEGLSDIGTLGGSTSFAQWLNDEGEVTGLSYLSGDQLFHAFVWKHGAMTDLGVPPGQESSRALSINASGQVVGESENGGTVPAPGWLWENGGPIVDLNQLVLPGSDLTVVSASFVNNRGEIAGEGLLPNGDVHAILLIPHGDCDDACDARIADSQSNPPTAHVSSMPNNRMPAMHGRLARRFQSPSPGPRN